MKAFKKVQDFAAKEQHLPDSQKGWQSWTSNQRGRKNSGDDDREQQHVDDHKGEDTTKRVKVDDGGEWTKLPRATDGTPYWFNPKTGEMRTSTPDSDSGGGEEEHESEGEGSGDDKAEKTAIMAARDIPAIPPRSRLPKQEWEKTTDSLTRTPAWFCAEIDATISFEPPADPWRGVKDPQGRVYFWNPETNETRWS